MTKRKESAMPTRNRTMKKKVEGFSAFEREAIQTRAKELAEEARADKNNAQGERDVLNAIAALSEPDRTMAKRLHVIITKSAPALSPKTWYGMPAYAMDGKVVCFFQGAQKFKARYASFGFSDTAKLDEGAIWPVAFALKKLTAAEEAKIVALVKRAIS